METRNTLLNENTSGEETNCNKTRNTENESSSTESSPQVKEIIDCESTSIYNNKNESMMKRAPNISIIPEGELLPDHIVQLSGLLS